MPTDSPPDIHAADRYFTSHQVGDILQVNPSSVVKWINDGILNAFRTPGGHRRVSASELIRFARHHGMPVPTELRDLALTKVLVVDDEPRFLGALQKAFKPYAEEITLQTCENGIDALMATGAFKPDVLILDVRMPGLDGFKVLERIRAYPETSHTTVIVMSGQMDEATVERCKKLGATTCLSKPVKIPELVETLRELRRPRYQWSAR